MLIGFKVTRGLIFFHVTFPEIDIQAKHELYGEVSRPFMDSRKGGPARLILTVAIAILDIALAFTIAMTLFLLGGVI